MRSKNDFWIKFFGIILISTISLTIILIKPSIYLKKGSNIIVDYNTDYKEPGYKATALMKTVTKDVKVEGKVDTKKIGIYKIKYTLDFNGIKFTNIRVVNVVDRENPTINLLGTNHACPNTDYKEEGYEATDNYDGDLTKKVKKIVTKNDIVYSVVDSSSNKTSIVRKIIYKDEEAPDLKLKGDQNVNVIVGNEYVDAGIDVNDNCDSDVSNKIDVKNDVDTTKPGSYTVIYTVVDKSGNKATISRNVNVVDEMRRGTGKNIYLTFDDGPSTTITPSLLQILKEENVKATFFVINHDDSLNYLIKQENDEGHVVALHSYTHNYGYIYSSTDNYFNDLNSIKDKVRNITGKSSNIIRFPGGSSNTVSTNYQAGIMTYLTSEVVKRGYYYFDWNVSSQDAGSARTSGDIYNNVVSNLDYANNVVLMHDYENNYKTLDAIRDIIRYGKENAYTFKTIDSSTPPVRHGVNN